MLHGWVTGIGPKQRHIWHEDKVHVLIMEVQSSLYSYNVAGASLLDVCPVGRSIETTFESVAIYFVENISTYALKLHKSDIWEIENMYRVSIEFITEPLLALSLVSWCV